MKKERKVNKCKRCGWIWVGKENPVTCPHCRSPYWNKDRIREIKNKKEK